MKKIFVALSASLVLVCGAALAAPSVQQIETAMLQGNWQDADAGLQQVLAAHPNSAHAHYLYAQVLNREGQYAQALTQLDRAKTLDPQLHFASPSRFAQVQARLRADAERVPTGQSSHPAMGASSLTPRQHGPTVIMWGVLAVVVIGIVFVLRRTLSRAKANDDARTDTDRRDQLKRATDLLNAVRSLKLDVRLSTAPGHEALEKEVEDFEAQLRTQIETMTNGNATLPPGQLDELERQFDGLKARAEGRSAPNADTTGSAYAREADANFGAPTAPPNAPPSQQPPVVIQQGGGFGGGLGGLLGGILLGQVLNGGRDRVIERDRVISDDAQQNGGLDFGQGNDWGDGGAGGGVDFGNDDSSGGWDSS